MYEFKPFKQIMEEAVIRDAKELAWNCLTTIQQNEYLALAKKEQDRHSQELAIKCWEEAEAAFNEPGFVSRGPKGK